MKAHEIKPENISDNVFKLIDQDWMLLTAGNKAKYNMMTASWGGMGIIWSRPVCYILIRPTRYTYEFFEANDMFSVNFFPNHFRKILNYCGSKSGRDVNKMALKELTPIEDHKTIYFQEARLILLCKKIYYQDIDPKNFLDPRISSNYSQKDYHRMYIGEIIKVYNNE
jgi:flavin reductase (DIM6/NTAB) family NADH-FMN oxidoreductase RutF